MPEFERPVPVDDPPPDPPGDPGGSRAVRRRPGLLLAAAVLVGAGLLVYTESQPASPEPEPSPTARAEAQPTPGSVPMTLDEVPVTLDLPGDPFRMDVGPTGYGVVVTASCADGQAVAEGCVGGVAVTGDFRHWQRRAMPEGRRPYATPTPLVLGHGALLLENLFADDPRRWHSADGGRHWRTVSPDVADPVPDATSGRLALESGDETCRSQRVVVLEARTGRAAPLRSQPTGIHPCAVTGFPDNCGNHLWVAGVDPRDDHGVTAVSTDDGRRWRTSRLPGTGPATYVEIQIAGCEAFAVVTLPTTGVRPTTAVYRYRDSTWTEMWRNDRIPVINPTFCVESFLFGLLLPAGDRTTPQLGYSLDSGRQWHVDGRFPPVLARYVPGWGWYGSSVYGTLLYSRTGCRHWSTVPVG